MDYQSWRRLKQLLNTKTPGWKMKNRLLISLILLSSIPVAIMALSSSFISNRIISDQTNQMHQVFLNQVEKEMNNQFKKFDELMLQYTYDNSALNRFTNDDLTYKNFQLVNDLFTVLTNLRSGMENVVEIDFYSTSFDKIATSSGFLLQPDEFFDPLALQKSKTLTRYGTWIDTRVQLNTRLDRPVITYIRPTYNPGSNAVKSFFIVYLDAATLSSKLKANVSDPATYLVLNASGYAVLHSDVAKVGSLLNTPNFIAELSKGKNLPNYRFSMPMDGKPSLINTVYSPNRDWYYVSILPTDLVAKQTNQLRNILLGVSLAFILLTVIIAIRTSSSIYQPVQRLTQRVFKHKESGKTKDEMHFIAEYIQNVEEHNDILKKNLKEYQATAEHYSLMSLLIGNSNDLTLQQGTFHNKQICLFLIETDPLYMKSQYSRGDQFLFYYAIENIVDEILSKQGKTRIMMIQPGLFAILHQPEHISSHVSRICANELLHAVRTYLKLNFVISVSYSESGLHGIHDAFLQAKRALRYSFSLGANQVIISDELDPAVSDQADALVDIENLIMHSLHASNYTEALEHFSQLIQLLKDDITLTSDVLKSYCSQLLGVMLHSVGKHHHEHAESVNMKQLTMELERQRNLQDIEAFFHKQFFDKLNAPQPEKTSLEKQQVDEVVAYIQAHYDEDISLQLCAELIGLSSSQLSRSFKKIMGINFVDYVIQHRVGIAKELLSDPKNSIQAVTEKLRYTSVNSFIRIFKKITGTTPGTYRKDAQDVRL
ncbi:helix-turn-helix domain-containing protein [Paenibacillus sp. N3.4]|uniref:helix-turn-helix domain-containing protein n=1 Tax=Paenibacillus sp. N3.4 TaxID=2603222 RepID=UPI00164F8297|nr:helix-turn-helix domain-containing protein [Paenibacillus sp. N3.4]